MAGAKAPTARPKPPDLADPFGILGRGASNCEDLLAHLAQGGIKLCAGSAGAPTARREALTWGAQQARPGDKCPQCRCPLQITEMEYECPSCHEVFKAADFHDVIAVSAPEGPGASSLRGRILVVGPGAPWYQSDMDRTNPGESSETQKKTMYAELRRYNEDYASRGGNPFPLNVLEAVAESYNVVQQAGVKRSMQKKSIIAALLYYQCLDRGFSRMRSEVAEFAQLTSRGIAQGDDYLRSIHEDRGLDINMNESRLGPHISTTFHCLDLGDEEYEPLRAAVAGIVEIAVAQNIGIRSALLSKVVATTCEVLRRGGIKSSSQSGGSPRSKSGSGKNVISIDEVAAKCQTRKHTIQNFLKELANYHSRFEEEYRRHGLDDSPPS